MPILEFDQHELATAAAISALLDGLSTEQAEPPESLSPPVAERLRVLMTYWVLVADAGHRRSSSPLPPLLPEVLEAVDTDADVASRLRRMLSWLPGMMRVAERNGLDELCWLLYASVEATVADLHDLDTWGAMTPSAMAAARRLGGAALARTLLVAGAWSRLSGRPDEAEELFSEAIMAYTMLGDHRLLAVDGRRAWCRP